MLSLLTLSIVISSYHRSYDCRIQVFQEIRNFYVFFVVQSSRLHTEFYIVEVSLLVFQAFKLFSQVLELYVDSKLCLMKEELFYCILYPNTHRNFLLHNDIYVCILQFISIYENIMSYVVRDILKFHQRCSKI